jgi:hypothetical protein
MKKKYFLIKIYTYLLNIYIEQHIQTFFFILLSLKFVYVDIRWVQRNHVRFTMYLSDHQQHDKSVELSALQ